LDKRETVFQLPACDQKFFSSPEPPNQFRGPPCPSSVGYRGPAPDLQRPVCQAASISVEIINALNYTSTVLTHQRRMMFNRTKRKLFNVC